MAYYGTTILLTLLPLFFIAAFLWWIRHTKGCGISKEKLYDDNHNAK